MLRLARNIYYISIYLLRRVASIFSQRLLEGLRYITYSRHLLRRGRVKTGRSLAAFPPKAHISLLSSLYSPARPLPRIRGELREKRLARREAAFPSTFPGQGETASPTREFLHPTPHSSTRYLEFRLKKIWVE